MKSNQTTKTKPFSTSMADISMATSPATNKPTSWGTGERCIPEQMTQDSASQKIVSFHLRHYQIASRYGAGKRVLDIACGGGYGSQILSQAGAASVVAVEISSEEVEYAKQHHQLPNITFICASAEQFEWSDTFDVIVCLETLEHLQHPRQFLEKMHRFLPKHGDLILAVPLGETRHFNPHHIHAFSKNDIFSLLESTGFEIDRHRCDELFMNRSELIKMGKQYPESAPPAHKLWLTPRGWRIVYDFVVRGGFRIPQLLVTARSI